MMNFEQFAPQLSRFPMQSRKQVAAIAQHNIIRDNFTLSTWLAIGALAQGALVLLVRPTYAVAPAFLLLSYRFIRTILMTFGIIRNTQMDGVVMGKYSVQIPDEQGQPPKTPSDKGVSVIMLGARTNHPLGMFGPGIKELGDYLSQMIVDLAKDPKTSGFLGSSNWTASTDRKTNNQFLVVCYFRSTDDIHRFAHGPLHREAWNWWNRIVDANPHLSIMHELYGAPKNHWENLFVNFHLNGIGKILTPIVVDGKEYTPIIDASRGPLSTHKGRLAAMEASNSGNDSSNEKEASEVFNN